ncbi:MAG TPA: hypothetical protein VGN30_21110 [Steroidobacteraceae bacterium]
MKWYVPGLSNLNEKLSFVSIAPERNNPLSLTTVCGSASMLAQVTVEPALIDNEFGVNMNSLTTIRFESGVSAVHGVQIAIPQSAATLTAANHRRHRPIFMCAFS